ncbi:flagellar hook-associated protein 3 FlgL [Yoonia vestfoldensis SKA53]|uniref:Flagellar hook-associated protein 3 FlgL n=2 Tax=Yoonia vestfoldensis TaxID=245188 RepID=A3V258_9RHOB|nr:flagellar hook-associated protein 3 FlgL [Yoonia vestfoldensis SKA53]
MLTRFSQVNKEIELRQTKISTGREITEASEKPIEAVKLSALEQSLTQLKGFQRNTTTAQQRLSLGDTVLASVDGIMAQLRERAISANTDTVSASDLAAIRVDVAQSREALIDLANSRTSDDQALFGGYATDIQPFTPDTNGRIQYRGDGGQHTLAASETTRLPTSVNGAEVFMQVDTSDGVASIFDIVDSFEAALLTDGSYASTLSADAGDELSLSFNGDRVPRDVSFDLQGPSGSTSITATDVVGGSHDQLKSAINKKSDETGVIATVVGGHLVLSAATGTIALSALKIEGVELASREPRFTIMADGEPPQTMVPTAQTLDAQLEKLVQAGQDIAVSRTKIGARLKRAEDQEAALQSRALALETDVNELGSADLGKVVTELQALLVSRDAAMQAYSRIGQSSLFDFLK